MKECEMCGRETELIKAQIEDTVLSVCKKCSSLGLKMEETTMHKTAIKPTIAVNELVLGFGHKIKEARESSGFSRQELAAKIGISAAMLLRIEKGFRPTDNVIKKLERELKISLFYKEATTRIKTEKLPEFTLGDVVELRLKKKV